MVRSGAQLMLFFFFKSMKEKGFCFCIEVEVMKTKAVRKAAIENMSHFIPG
jgi:hypothetical protein